MTRHAAAFVALFGALALGFFLLNGDHAYHPTDDGFMLAYSWRVAHGEVPYRDYLSVRTPLTPYLHAVWLALPAGWQIQAGRLAFYLELAASGAVLAVWAAARLGLRATPRALALTAMGLLLAAHNFPPMPWPTVDAVLFSAGAIAAFLFSLDAPRGRAQVLRAASSLLVALAVLAKQSFAPVAFLLVAYAAVEAVRARSWSRLLASLIPGAAVALVTLALLAANGALGDFVYQLQQPGKLTPTIDAPWYGDFFHVGIDPYLRSLGPLALLFALAGYALVWWGDDPSPRVALARKAASLGVFAALAMVGTEVLFDVYDAGRRLLFLLAGVLVAQLLRAARGRADPRVVLASTAILVAAYCSGLSFAYQTPLLGLAGLVVLLDPAFPRIAWPAERLAVALATAAVAVSVLLADLEKPYREVPRDGQTADLGTVYPAFGHLYTSPENVARFRELRELSTAYALSRGRPVVAMPDYPLISFLTGQRPPLRLDWLQPQEYLGNEDGVRADLLASGAIVLVEREVSLTVGPDRDGPMACDRPRPDSTPLVAWVMTRWVRLAEGEHFCVYRAP